jgi:Mrp family chromosome partitioning ATPase
MVTDAVILGNKVDGVLLVVAADGTEEQMLAAAQEKLERAEAKLAGTILNKYPVKETNHNYYGATGRYGADRS